MYAKPPQKDTLYNRKTTIEQQCFIDILLENIIKNSVYRYGRAYLKNALRDTGQQDALLNYLMKGDNNDRV